MCVGEMRGGALKGMAFRNGVLLWLCLSVCIQLCASNPPGCECISDNDNMGDENQARFGDEYGTWCASWDDGICVPTKFVYDEGEHPCEGTHSGSCDELWPDLDWQKDQSQCCDSWCYVNPNTCNASEWGIDLQESLITRDLPAESKLWYSYGACPDWRTRSKYPPDGSKDYAGYSNEDCPYRPFPLGCNCVDNSLLGDDLLIHGKDYGRWCAAWEDDACDPEATAADAPWHTCDGTHAASCQDHWPATDWTQNQFFCCDAWCYVNQTCDGKKHRIDVKNSWVTAELKYSYGACADFSSKPTPRGKSGWLADWAYYESADCPWRAKVEGCECIGDNSGLGEEELALRGEDYGKWCAAWDDGKCTDESAIIPDSRHTVHTCKGTLEQERTGCDALWGQRWNFSAPQTWCCSAWCYVDINTCTPELQERHGIKVAQSWVSENIYYSYEACFDSIIRPTAPSHGPLDYAQYNKDTCPYSKGVPGFVYKQETFTPITDPIVKETFDIYIQQNNNRDTPTPSSAPLSSSSSSSVALLLASSLLLLLGRP